MRAVAIEVFGGPETLRVAELPRPKPGPGEVLIHVVAAGVNPVDWKIREGHLDGLFPHRFPLIPGWDAAGVVEELGEGTHGTRKGARVWAYARKPEVCWGTYAEYVAVPEAHVAPIPPRFLFEEAAAVPLAALTAWQALFDVAGVRRGMTVLVHAAAGGVGHFAVQLARGAGARVLGTASAANTEFVLSQGAEEVLDYTREDFREGLRARAPEGADVVLDAVGGETLVRSFDVVKPGGCVVSIVERPDPGVAARRGVRAEFVFVRPDGGQLRAIGALAAAGKLRPHVRTIYSLAEAATAQIESATGHVRGKLVLAL